MRTDELFHPDDVVPSVELAAALVEVGDGLVAHVVVEADEYDRSFHYLSPYMSVVTAVDADHLDIYGTEEAYREAFAHYTSLHSTSRTGAQ